MLHYVDFFILVGGSKCSLSVVRVLFRYTNFTNFDSEIFYKIKYLLPILFNFSIPLFSL